LVERVLYHSTRRVVPERSWVQSLLPTTEVEPGFFTFGGMLVLVLQLISPVCKTGTSLLTARDPPLCEFVSFEGQHGREVRSDLPHVIPTLWQFEVRAWN
jgi:hypothetical protein